MGNQAHPIYSSMLAAHSVILSITPLVYLPIRLGSLIALLDLGLQQTLKKALRHLQSASQRPHLLRRAILQTSLADPPQLLALQTPREQLRQASQLMRTVELTEIQMLRSM